MVKNGEYWHGLCTTNWQFRLNFSNHLKVLLWENFFHWIRVIPTGFIRSQIFFWYYPDVSVTFVRLSNYCQHSFYSNCWKSDFIRGKVVYHTLPLAKKNPRALIGGCLTQFSALSLRILVNYMSFNDCKFWQGDGAWQ